MIKCLFKTMVLIYCTLCGSTYNLFHHNLHLKQYIFNIALNCCSSVLPFSSSEINAVVSPCLKPQDSMIHHSLSNLPTHATLQNSTWCHSNPHSFKNVFISYSLFTYSLPKDHILLHKLLCHCSSSTHS